MSEKFQPPRGTRDWWGDDAARRRRAIDLAREVFEPAGYGEIVTPVFEDTELFARSSGESSDVVRKEMYSFEDRSGRLLTLRPESTAPVMRAYLNEMTRLPQPVKLWYTQAHYRYNAVQRGRAREHYQFGVEVIGSEDPAVDAEVIALQRGWYERCEVPGLRLELNSIGDANCRPAYIELLTAFIDRHLDQLDDECRERRKTNPLRVLDCKNPSCRAIMADAPRITDHLCDACAEHFAEVRRHLDARGVEYELEPTLVRGLDYYTRTTWEWTGAGLATSISGGGRYDGLAEDLGGPPTPGVGFGTGLERIRLACAAERVDLVGRTGVDVYVVDTTGGFAALALTHELRSAGISADRAWDGRSFKAQFKAADRAGARVAVVVGPDEASRHVVGLKPMRGGEQVEVPVDQVASQVRKMLDDAE